MELVVVGRALAAGAAGRGQRVVGWDLDEGAREAGFAPRLSSGLRDAFGGHGETRNEEPP